MRLAMHGWLLAGVIGCGTSPTPGSNSTEDTDEPWFDPVAELVQHGQVACTDPAQRSLTPWYRSQIPSSEEDIAWIYGGGVVTADFDGDGNLEIFSPNQDPQAGFMVGTGGRTFAERGDLLAPFDLSYATGGTAVDYDGDGDLDLYVTRYEQPNVMLRNDGDLMFTDVTDETGLTACDSEGCYRSMSSSWADYDRDGDLDLVASNYGYVPHDGSLAADLSPGDPSFLYRNDGGGKFTDVTEQVIPHGAFDAVHDGYTYISSFIDLDMDGWPELYFINDFGTAYKNTLLYNQQGTLTLDRGLRGLDLEMTGMCLGVADLNDDLRPDLFMTEWASLTILQSFEVDGFPLWIGVEEGAIGLKPVSPQKVPWGCSFGDIDLDGDSDLAVAFGFVFNEATAAWVNPMEQPDSVYVQGDEMMFTDMAPSWGMNDARVGRGVVLADFDNDGWLDVFKRDLKGPDVHYAAQCGEGTWLEVALRQPGTMNTHAVGAVVDVTVGEKTMRRWVMAGGLGFATAPPLDVHFGLAGAEVVDSLVVHWPDGETSTFVDVPARQRLTVSRR